MEENSGASLIAQTVLKIKNGCVCSSKKIMKEIALPDENHISTWLLEDVDLNGKKLKDCGR